MFRDAYEITCKFTFPVVQYNLTTDGKCLAGAAAFIVVNDEGWIVTAAHVMRDSVLLAQADAAARKFESQRDAIQKDASLSAKARAKKLDELGKPNKKTTRRGATAWAFDGVRLVDISILDEADLAVGRLDGFDKVNVAEYPTFKDPTKDFRPGASLCKLGYPFAELTPVYDEQTNMFVLPPDRSAVTFFPIEGIFTRTISVSPEQPPDRLFPIEFIETSSPGLRGQSGGPTFDTNGAIWAIQSQTRHLPLGFSPEVKHEGKPQKEHQFLNVGMGVSVGTVLGFLNQLGIVHKVA
jgi:hypothetical protein